MATICVVTCTIHVVCIEFDRLIDVAEKAKEGSEGKRRGVSRALTPDDGCGIRSNLWARDRLTLSLLLEMHLSGEGREKEGGVSSCPYIG